MRKLASIQRIWKIEPIEGADRIELAHVLGWQCVVNKGQFKEMDLAVYFEIDSFLPVCEPFEFLRKSSYKKSDIMGEGFLLRTMKFKGQISQGLLLPLAIFPLPDDMRLGADVTTLLGVRKWEIEERATTGGTVIGKLPNGVPHTDETRIQTNPDLLRQFDQYMYYITTKMDGSSHSLFVDDEGTVHVCGHNFEYKDDGSSAFYEFVKKNGWIEKLREFWERNKGSLCIQGEFCAPGIQKNRLKLTRPAWYVFTVIKNQRRVIMPEMVWICDKLGLEHVPIEESGVGLALKYPTVEDLLRRAEGEYPNGGQKEGIVIRTVFPVEADTESGYLSIKVINNQYLLMNSKNEK